MASKPGGYSGGRDGPMGGRVGGASGTGHESNRGGRGNPSSDQRHRNRLSEIARVGRVAQQSTQADNSGTSPAGRTSATLQGMARDYRNVGNSMMDNFGNRLAGLFGFNEQRPSIEAAKARSTATPGAVTDHRAGWGFDPVVPAASLMGSLFGVPFTGTFADQISARFNRPLEMSMGPSVFGGMPSGVPSSPPQGGGTGMASYSPFQAPQGIRPAQPVQSAAAPQSARSFGMPSLQNQYRSIPGPSQYGVYTPFLG